MPTDHEMWTMERAGTKALLFSDGYDSGLNQFIGYVGIFDEASQTMTGPALFSGQRTPVDQIVFDPNTDIAYFGMVQPGVGLRIYGYDTVAEEMVYDKNVDLGIVASAYEVATGQFSGTVDAAGNVYISVLYEVVGSPYKEGYQIIKIPAP